MLLPGEEGYPAAFNNVDVNGLGKGDSDDDG